MSKNKQLYMSVLVILTWPLKVYSWLQHSMLQVYVFKNFAKYDDLSIILFSSHIVFRTETSSGLNILIFDVLISN